MCRRQPETTQIQKWCVCTRFPQQSNIRATWNLEFKQTLDLRIFFVVFSFFKWKFQPFHHIGLWNFDKVNTFRQKKCGKKCIPKIHIFRGPYKNVSLYSKKCAHVSNENKAFAIFYFTFLYPPKKICTFQTKTNKRHNRSFDLFFLGFLDFSYGAFYRPCKISVPYSKGKFVNLAHIKGKFVNFVNELPEICNLIKHLTNLKNNISVLL